MEPKFKLHFARFGEGPTLWTKWREAGYNFDVYQRREPGDREIKEMDDNVGIIHRTTAPNSQTRPEHSHQSVPWDTLALVR